MKICIDLRSLSKEQASGVENYSTNVVESLLTLDKKNIYTLFFNSFGEKPNRSFNYINSKTLKTNYPNKLLNLALKTKVINFESLVGEQDWLFLPNLNQFNISSKTKLALTVHDLSPVITPEFYDLKRRVWHKFLNYKRAFQRANVIFAVSEYTKLDLLRLFNVPENKIKVVYPGVSPEILNLETQERNLRQIRNIYGLPKDYFLFLNTLEPRKNLTGLLKAFLKIQNPSSLVIVGKPGWKYGKIFKAIEKNPKKNKIKYLGYVPENHKPAIMKMATALVYPSFYEGFGFQPLEAMALGTPVIESSVTALPEISNNASFLINPYNIKEIAQAMDEVFKSKSLREVLKAKGLERVKNFTWTNTAQRILEELNSN